MSTKGNGYLGSSKLETSSANQEIVPQPPSHLNWTSGYKLYKFSFSNRQATQVIINNATTIYLEAGQGFEMETGDASIYSFIIVEPDITFNWIAAY